MLTFLKTTYSIVCSNRDEILSRPTLPAHFHNFGFPVVVGENEGEVLSGRDVEAGGTWLGITRSGRIALLYVKKKRKKRDISIFSFTLTEKARTNIPGDGPPDAHYPSRGAVISSFLVSASSDSPPSFFTSTYAGFNLLLLTPTAPTSSASLSYDAAIASNHGSGGDVLLRSLTDAERRLGGFSNGPDGEKAGVWKKVQRGLELMHEVLERDGNEEEATLVDGLFGLLE
jgi:uncharacterized protein with NRDE domain